LPASHEILLSSADRELQRSVARASEIAPELAAHVTACQDLRELERRLSERSRPVALVDAGTQPLAVLAKLEPLARRFGDTRFVVICREFQTEVLLEAMQVGARHCMVRSALEVELPAVLRRLLQDAAPARGAGRLVTVLSASGGCGATTIAINLAEEARIASGAPVLLVDLDRHYGTMGAYLGLEAQYGLGDVLLHGGAIDDHLVRSTAARYSDGLDVLLGPASLAPGVAGELSLERLTPAVAAFARAYPLTVVDAPRLPIDVAAELAVQSRLTLVVFELSVVDIRGARALLVALNDRRVAPENVLAVANRYRKRNPMLSLDDAQKALAGWDVVRVENDYTSALKSINLGVPLSRAAPRSDLRRDVQALAARAAGRANGVPR
jgi:pilus assembly protein CpaE